MQGMRNTRAGFEKKWVSYALAGGTALALPTGAEAARIELFIEDGYDEEALDVDGDGVDDYVFYVQSPGIESTDPRAAGINGATASNLVYGDFAEFGGIPFGNFVTAFDSIDDIGGSRVSGGKFLKDKIGGGFKGDWQENDLSVFHYAGLSFESSGVKYKGWAQVSVHLGSAALTVEDAGAVAVPEPGSMGLLLLGATGVAAFRRRHA